MMRGSLDAMQCTNYFSHPAHEWGDRRYCYGVAPTPEVEAGERETVHATLTAYTKDGCRCDPCREFWNTYMRWWRVNKQGRVHGACETCTCPMPEKPGKDPAPAPTDDAVEGVARHDLWWDYLCPPLANIGALKQAQSDLIALGADWAEAGRILSRVQKFYVDAAFKAAAAAVAAGYVSPEQAREREAAAWDAGWLAKDGRVKTRASNPYRGDHDSN